MNPCALPLVAGLSDELLHLLSTGQGLVGYGVMVLALLLGCLGMPVPEEAVFATAGTAAKTGALSLVVAYPLGVATILGLDLALFEIGRRAGPRLEGSRFGRRIPRARLDAAHRFFERHGAWAVVGARFVMGTRIPTMLLAGALGLSRRRFLLADGCAALVSTAIPMALGYLFSDRLRELLDALGTLRGAVYLLIAALLLTALLWLWRMRVARRSAPDDVVEESP